MFDVLSRVAGQLEDGEVTVPGLGRFSIYEGRSERIVRLRYAVRADHLLDGSVVLEGVAAELIAALREGPVTIPTLGTFSIGRTEAVEGRHPVTREPIHVPSRPMVRFVGARR